MGSSRITFTLSLILFAGCASSPKQTCPSVEEEAISVCRAQAKCKDQNSSVGVGVGFGLGRGIGVGMGSRQSTDRYTNCVDQDLKDQEAKAKQRDSSLPPD